MDREQVDEEEEELKTRRRERQRRGTICGQSSDATIMHSTNPVGFAMGIEKVDEEEEEEEEWKKRRRERRRRRRRKSNRRSGASERRRHIWAWGQSAKRMWDVLCCEGWVGVEWEMCEWEVARRREARWMQEAKQRRKWLEQARWLEELWLVAMGGPIWKA